MEGERILKCVLFRKAATRTKAANFSGDFPVVGRYSGIGSTDKTPGSRRQVRHLQHWLIAVALSSSLYLSALTAEPLEEVNAAITGAVSEPTAELQQETLRAPPVADQDYFALAWDNAGFAIPGISRGKAAYASANWTDTNPAPHNAQPFKHTQIGVGLRHDAIAMDWFGIYVQNLDRVAERNTIYGLLRETASLGSNDSKTLSSVPCCQSRGTVTLLGQHEKAITRFRLSPTFFVFGLLQNKGYDLKLSDGWKLQAGVRHMDYGNTYRTRLGYFTMERSWQKFQAAYSFQLERAGGTSAPSHVLQLDYLYSPGNLIGISLANGREFANFGALGVLQTEARNVTVRGQHLFKQGWALTFQAGYIDHGSLPAQKAFRIGIRHNF